MASLKALRLRIKSVKATRQITKTMKMVAAAKVRKARVACEDARPYADRLGRVLTNLATAQSGGGPLLLTGRENVKTVRIIVMGSDRGLCGGLNANVMKRTRSLIAELQERDRKVQLVTVGRKVRDGLKREFDILHSYTERQDYDLCREISEDSIRAFENGLCDRVVLVYARFVNMLTQKPTTFQLAPFQVIQTEETAGLSSSFEYEPNEEQILAELLPQNVSIQLYQGLLETFASEQAARMTAMDNATRNAGDVIKKLNLEFNRTRQAAVTTELTEIISGAEAV